MSKVTEKKAVGQSRLQILNSLHGSKREGVSFEVSCAMIGLVGWENQQLSLSKVKMEMLVLRMYPTESLRLRGHLGKRQVQLVSSAYQWQEKPLLADNWSQHRSPGDPSEYRNRRRETGGSFSRESEWGGIPERWCHLSHFECGWKDASGGLRVDHVTDRRRGGGGGGGGSY